MTINLPIDTLAFSGEVILVAITCSLVRVSPVCILASLLQVIEMPHRSGSKRSRTTPDESATEHGSMSEVNHGDHSSGVPVNAKRVRWDNPPDLGDEHDFANSDSSDLAKVTS